MQGRGCQRYVGMPGGAACVQHAWWHAETAFHSLESLTDGQAQPCPTSALTDFIRSHFPLQSSRKSQSIQRVDTSLESSPQYCS